MQERRQLIATRIKSQVPDQHGREVSYPALRTGDERGGGRGRVELGSVEYHWELSRAMKLT